MNHILDDTFFLGLILNTPGTYAFFDRETETNVYFDDCPDLDAISLKEQEVLKEAILADVDGRYLPYPRVHDFEIMEEFAEEAVNPKVRRRLEGALAAKHPMSSFNDRVEELGVRNEWEEYRAVCYDKIIADWRRDNEI